MNQVRKIWHGDDEVTEVEQAEANRLTASLGGLVIALLLVVVGLFLIKELHSESLLEECMMSGSGTCQVMPLH